MIIDKIQKYVIGHIACILAQDVHVSREMILFLLSSRKTHPICEKPKKIIEKYKGNELQ